MVIEKVHGLQATSISLNDRFTILATAIPMNRIKKPRRRPSGLFSYNQNISNQSLIDQLTQRLGQQNKRRGVRQRLSMPGLRRFGSESSVVGLQRSNSFSNLSQSSVRKRVAWRQSNGNLNRSASFSNLSQGMRGRGFRRRGGRMGVMRGRVRGRGGRVTWQQPLGRLQGQRARRGTPGRGRGRGRVARQGGGQGRGQGVGVAPRQPKLMLTKEELDKQLDQYMASTKAVLDKELDAYMMNAMDLE